MEKHSIWQNLLLFGAGTAILAAVYFGDPEIAWQFAREDGAVENLTALAYLFGMLACVWAIYTGRHVRMAIVWLVLCFVFLGEEVSWFQRILGYSVPAVEAINAQGEFNLHNLGDGAPFLSETGQFSFAFEKLLYSQNLYRAGFFVFFLIIPVAVLVSSRVRAFMNWWHYLRPSNSFLLAVWSVITISFVLTAISPELTRNSIAEFREFYWAFAIFLYTWMLAAPFRSSDFAWSGHARPV